MPDNGTDKCIYRNEPASLLGSWLISVLALLEGLLDYSTAGSLSGSWVT